MRFLQRVPDKILSISTDLLTIYGLKKFPMRITKE